MWFLHDVWESAMKRKMEVSRSGIQRVEGDALDNSSGNTRRRRKRKITTQPSPSAQLPVCGNYA